MENKFDIEELEILELLEDGKLKSKTNDEDRKAELSEYAKNTIKKNKRVNIRISERDLTELQRQAITEGLPYQTFISSILHRFVNGNLSR
jgi:predicted DNA binding CopG/RHH family protein